jgi:E3 ubiquitin-protein ligase TRIP12
MSGSRNAQNGNEDVVMPDSDDIYTQAATSSRNTTTNTHSNASIRDVEMADDTDSTSSRRRKSSTVDDDLYYHPSARNRDTSEEDDHDEDEDENDDEEHDLNILSRNSARRFRNSYQDESDENEENEDEEDEDDEDEDEDEEEDDDEVDAAAGRRSLRTAESLMAHFLDLDSLSQAVMGITTRVNPLIEAITQRDDPMAVLIGLQEFAELILMSHEEIILEALPFSKVLDALSDVLVNPLFEDNVEISLMGCRCVSNLLDAAPSSLDKFSYSSVVTSLCHKLFEVQYIDIVEIALTV